MKKIYLLFGLLLFITNAINAQYNATVAQNGTGNYTTLQAAINAAPTNSTTPWVIYIANGFYYEKINIPSNKPFIQLIGQSVSGVTVSYDDYAGKPIAGGGTLGTQNSASVTINAADFTAMNITFENGFKYDSAAAAGVSGLQAVAVTINADRCAFKNCRFIGMQDTLYTKGSGNPRHYFYKCYIDGIVDFIFGSSIAIFDSTVVYPKSRTGTGSSYITAANTTTGQAYGYWFKDCKIPRNTGATLYYLGRPWNNATSGVTAANKTVYTNCQMSSSINPLGWSVWDAGTNTSVITYAEYQSKKFDGSLVDVSNRVAWSKQFTNADTVGYNVLNVFNGWNPCSVRTDFCDYKEYDVTITNAKAIRNNGMLDITWNTSWAMSGVTYTIYKSSSPTMTPWTTVGIPFTTGDDTTYNFAITGLGYPPIGTTEYYAIRATKGSQTITSPVLKVSNEPNINTTTDSLKNFLQGSTAPSNAQSFIVNASNLLDSIKVVAPANFEISMDNSTWVNSGSYIKLTPTNNTLANTTIYVRLNAASAANYIGNIVFTTPNISSTTTKSVYVQGTTTNFPLQIFNVIQQWDLTKDDTDNASIRHFACVPTVPRFNKLYASNGTQVPAIAAYSTQFGQAFGATANGDGTWSTASGGPGGNLNRNYYEEFTIKPNINTSPGTQIYSTIRVDSILMNTAFYNTSSNIKFAVAYSRSNFTMDSANVIGGRDGAGLPLAASANGAFTTPVILSNQTGGPTAQYALALSADTGITLQNPDDSLKIRLYYSCGSGNAGRYAMLKNVQIKGEGIVLLPLKFRSLTLNPSPKERDFVKVLWTTDNEVNVSHFNIQRSSDGRRFETIGKVNAKNKGINEYQFTDDRFPLTVDGKPLTVYYRIIAIDKDGKATLSETKTLNSKPQTSNFKLYPNPANSSVTIETKEAKELMITDDLGKTVYHTNINRTSYIVNCTSFTKGIYIVKMIMNNGEIKTEKLIVE